MVYACRALKVVSMIYVKNACFLPTKDLRDPGALDPKTMRKRWVWIRIPIGMKVLILMMLAKAINLTWTV